MKIFAQPKFCPPKFRAGCATGLLWVVCYEQVCLKENRLSVWRVTGLALRQSDQY